MSFSLVVGRPNAGKTGVLYQVVRESVAQGLSPVVALPSRPDARIVAREFTVRGPRLGVTVTWLDAYIDALWAMYGDGRRVVGHTERAMLLAHAVRGCQLKELERSAAGSGFVGLLEPLAANGVEQIAKPRAQDAAGEIGDVLRSYRVTLGDANLIERADGVRRLETGMCADWFSGPIIANRFSDLTPLQERFLVECAEHTDVWLALPWQEAMPATRALDPLVDRLVSSGALLKAEPARDYTQSKELRYLEAHLFSQLRSARDTPRLGDIRLSQAYGEEAEAHRIAAEARAALDEGVPAEQIAIVFNDAADHVAALKGAMAEAGIQEDYDVVRAARNTGWGRALVQLTAFASGGTRASLLGLLRTKYSGVSADGAERLEAQWRRRRVDGMKHLIESLRTHDPQAKKLVTDARGLLTETGARWPEAARKWKNLADTLMRNAYGRNAALLDAEGIADAAAHREFLRLVSSMSDLPAHLAEGQALMEAFRQANVAVSTPPRDGAVRVMSASRARSQRFQVVIVGGLAEGDFPKPAAESPLHVPETARALARMGVELGRKDEQDAARLMFYLVASRATKQLILSRQVAASDGSGLAASWLLEELLDLYREPGADHASDRDLPPVTVLGFDQQAVTDAAAPSRRRLLREAALGRGGPLDDASAQTLARACRRAMSRAPVLLDERVLTALSERQVFSATEIESYLRCPYLWFHDRVVRAEALEPEAGAIERGRMCHEALRRIYTRLPEAVGAPRVTSGNLDEVLELARDVLDAVILDEGEATTVVQISTVAAVRRRVLGFLRAEPAFLPGFEPAALELTFGPDAAIFDGFQLKGRIDRVDCGPGGELVVVDYKTGVVGADQSWAKFEKRGLLQLALYARVVESLLGAHVVGGLYRGVSGQNVRAKQNRGFYPDDLPGVGLVGTDRMDDEGIAEVVSDAQRRAAEAVTGMRDGRIPAEPLDPRSCEKCRLSGFCPGVHR